MNQKINKLASIDWDYKVQVSQKAKRLSWVAQGIGQALFKTGEKST